MGYCVDKNGIVELRIVMWRNNPQANVMFNSVKDILNLVACDAKIRHVALLDSSFIIIQLLYAYIYIYIKILVIRKLSPFSLSIYDTMEL